MWLTPRSQWRERYKGWGAMAKLRYVDRMARRLRATEPVRAAGRHRHHGRGDGDDRRGLLQEGAARSSGSPGRPRRSTPICATSSASRKRRKKGTRPAADLLKENRKALIDKVTYWTGVQRPLVKRLVESIEARVGELGLRAAVRSEKENLTEVTAYATALAMNYLARGKFVQP